MKSKVQQLDKELKQALIDENISQNMKNENFRSMICQNSNDIEMVKLKMTNERKELEMKLREDISEPAATNETDNVFLDLLENVLLKCQQLRTNIEKSEVHQREQMICLESNLEEKQKATDTSLALNTDLCKKDLQSTMQNLRKIFSI